MSDMDQIMHQQTKATAIRSAIYRTDHVATHRAPGVAIETDAAVMLRAAAAKYLEIVERLGTLKPDVYQRLCKLRDNTLKGPHHDALTDAINLLTLLEVDYV